MWVVLFLFGVFLLCPKQMLVFFFLLGKKRFFGFFSWGSSSEKRTTEQQSGSWRMVLLVLLRKKKQEEPQSGSSFEEWFFLFFFERRSKKNNRAVLLLFWGSSRRYEPFFFFWNKKTKAWNKKNHLCFSWIPRTILEEGLFFERHHFFSFVWGEKKTKNQKFVFLSALLERSILVKQAEEHRERTERTLFKQEVCVFLALLEQKKKNHSSETHCERTPKQKVVSRASWRTPKEEPL